MTQYITYPVNDGGGVPIYATSADLPATATDGDLAVVADTHTLYMYDGDTLAWVPIASEADLFWVRASSVLSPANVNDSIAIAATTAAAPNIKKSSANESAEMRVGSTDDGSHTTAGFVVTDLAGARSVHTKLDAIGVANGIRAEARAQVESNNAVAYIRAGSNAGFSSVVCDMDDTAPVRSVANVADNAAYVAFNHNTTQPMTNTSLANWANDGVSKVKFGPQGQITSAPGIVSSRAALGALNINFLVDQILTKAISTNSTLTVSNPVQGKTVLLECTSSSSATLTLPTGSVLLNGTYDVTGALNYVFIFCNDSSTPTFLVTINQP